MQNFFQRLFTIGTAAQRGIVSIQISYILIAQGFEFGLSIVQGLQQIFDVGWDRFWAANVQLPNQYPIRQGMLPYSRRF